MQRAQRWEAAEEEQEVAGRLCLLVTDGLGAAMLRCWTKKQLSLRAHGAAKPDKRWDYGATPQEAERP